MANPLSPPARERVVASCNKLIAEAQNPDYRRELADTFGALLCDLGSYKGFNYVEWINGGHSRWVAAGKPNDSTPYLGDKSRVIFY